MRSQVTLKAGNKIEWVRQRNACKGTGGESCENRIDLRLTFHNSNIKSLYNDIILILNLFYGILSLSFAQGGVLWQLNISSSGSCY